MKRRKRKKVTAMGLAVVMAATVPMRVFATEGVEENTQVNEQGKRASRCDRFCSWGTNRRL